MHTLIIKKQIADYVILCAAAYRQPKSDTLPGDNK